LGVEVFFWGYAVFFGDGGLDGLGAFLIERYGVAIEALS